MATLAHMRTPRSVNDTADNAWLHSETRGDGAAGVSRSRLRANRSNVVVGEFLCEATFPGSVCRIVHFRPDKQMRRIHAGRVIAAVADQKTCDVVASATLGNHSSGQSGLPVDVQDAVVLLVGGEGPQDAFVRVSAGGQPFEPRMDMPARSWPRGDTASAAQTLVARVAKPARVMGAVNVEFTTRGVH